jgi:hypothetical protein
MQSQTGACLHIKLKINNTQIVTTNRAFMQGLQKQFSYKFSQLQELGQLSQYSNQDSGWMTGKGRDFFLFLTLSRLALRSTQPPIRWTPRALSLGVKQQGHGADHSPPSYAKVKSAQISTAAPPDIFMA